MVGCWTCRARKKRCGQQKPSCDECKRLGLQCDGYGQRPDWADGGRKENDHKIQLKACIKLRHRSKRTHSLPVPLLSLPSSHMPLKDFDDLASADDLHTYFDEHFQTLVPQLSGKIEGLQFLPIEIPVPPYEDLGHPLTAMRMSNPQNIECCSRGSIRSSAEPTFRGSISEACGAFYDIDECQLLLHYLDSVFWIQYPHLEQTNATIDRTWILALFQSSREFKRVLLHLSRYFKATNHDSSLGTEAGDTECSIIIDTLFERVKALTSEERSNSIESAIPLISASAMLAYYGTMAGQRDCVHSSLLVARTLLEQVRRLDGDTWVSQYEALTITDAHHHLCLAVRFSVAQLLWIDTFEAALTSSPCILELCPITERLGLDHELEVSFGFRVWTIQAVREAIELVLWKRTCLMNGRLSVRELASRSEILLVKIKEFPIATATNFDPSAVPATAACETLPISDSSPSSSPSSQDHWNLSSLPFKNDIVILTRIYTQATAIYIHLIVSGANSNLLEIRSCISSALELISQLRSIDALACMVWPLTIFCCLSANSHREKCKSILDRAMHRPKLRRACMYVSDLAQRCWHLDDETPMMPWNWENVFRVGFVKS